MSESKFNRFLSIVENEAKKLNKAFFMDTGEGHDGETEDLEMEDLSGWLVPKELAEEFTKHWEKPGFPHNIPDEFDEPFYVLAVWSIDDKHKINVIFK